MKQFLLSFRLLQLDLECDRIVVGEIDAAAFFRPLCDRVRFLCSLRVGIDKIDLYRCFQPAEIMECTADLRREILYRERLVIVAVFDGLAAGLRVQSPRMNTGVPPYIGLSFATRSMTCLMPRMRALSLTWSR